MFVPNPGFDIWLLVKVAFVNTLIALILYYIISTIINRSGKSNAYPWYIIKNKRL